MATPQPRWSQNKPGGKDDGDIDFDDIPLHRKRPFGAGISRDPIKFVPASASGDGETVGSSTAVTTGQSCSDAYLSIVFRSKERSATGSLAALTPTSDATSAATSVPSSAGASPLISPSSSSTIEPPPTTLLSAVRTGSSKSSSNSNSNSNSSSSSSAPDSSGGGSTCEACRLPLSTRDSKTGSHEALLAHQVSLAHSHPPSSLDRSRMGLGYLRSYGWDPDARQGLGPERRGIAFPLRARPKEDRLGLGAGEAKSAEEKSSSAKRPAGPATELKPKLLDAGKVRKMEIENRKKAERLRRQIYGITDLDKYLGPGA